MVKAAAVLLFSWGALSGGFGAYALVAAFQSESLFHAVQAGISLLIATVAVSTGFLVVIVGGLKHSTSSDHVVPPPAAEERSDKAISPPAQV
jgi:hypothetical protein